MSTRYSDFASKLGHSANGTATAAIDAGTPVTRMWASWKIRALFQLLIVVLGICAARPVSADNNVLQNQAPVGPYGGIYDDSLATAWQNYINIEEGYGHWKENGCTPTMTDEGPFSAGPSLVAEQWHGDFLGPQPKCEPYVNYTGDMFALVYTCTSGYFVVLQGVPQCTSNQPALHPGQVPGKNKGGKCIKCNGSDPINDATGNLYDVETDFVGEGPFPLRIQRYYNSDTIVTGSFGSGWTDYYSRRITPAWGTNSSATAYRHDGSAFTFAGGGNHSGFTAGIQFTSDPDVADRLLTTSSGFTLYCADGTTEYYDTTGRLTSIVLYGGAAQTLTYPNGTMVVTDGLNRTLTYTYFPSGAVASVTNTAGSTWSYGYNTTAAGATNIVLKTATKPPLTVGGTMNLVRTYVYENTAYPTALTGIVDENNHRYATWKYDQDGHANYSQMGAQVVPTQLLYDYTAGTTTIQDPADTSRVYTYTVLNGVVKVSTQSGGPCHGCEDIKSISYDAAGYPGPPTSGTNGTFDSNGNVTQYKYNDARGMEIQRIEGAGTTSARTINTTPDLTFQEPGEIDVLCCGSSPSLKSVTKFIYWPSSSVNAGALQTKTITDEVTGVTRTWSYTWTPLGQLASESGPRPNQTTMYKYDSSNHLQTIKNALSQTVVTFSQYNANGQPMHAVDFNNAATDYTYDPYGRVISKSWAGQITSWAFDQAGPLHRTVDADNVTLTYGYDYSHRLTSITNNTGESIQYGLDDFGNRVSEQVLDATGALKKKVSRLTDPVTGNVLEEDEPTGEKTKFGYYLGGQLNTVTKAGYITTYGLDSLNRVTSVQEPTTGNTTYPTTFGYDAFGNVTTVKDSKNLTTTTTYDAFGRVLGFSSPDRGTWNAAYNDAPNNDPANPNIVWTDAKGVTAKTTLDLLDRVTSVVYPNNVDSQYFYYDGVNTGSASNQMGHLTGAVVGSDRAMAYYFNPRGTEYAEVDSYAGNGYVTYYGYSSADRLYSIQYPADGNSAGGDYQIYHRDTVGQVDTVYITLNGQGGTLADTIKYYPFGPWKSMHVANGTSTTRNFDQSYRITGISANNGALLGLTYAYGDGLDNITSIANSLLPNRNQILTYDGINELLTASGYYQGGTVSKYTYSYNATTRDRATIQIGSGGVSSYYYPSSSHQLVPQTPPQSPFSWQYDANGNRYFELNMPPTPQEQFDQSNQLITSSSGATMEYSWDGHRIEKTGATHTDFIYARNGQLVQENGSQTAKNTEYFMLDGEPIAMATFPSGVPTLYYYHNDHHQTPQKMTDAGGNVVWAGDYEPFGAVTMTVSTITNNLRAPGQYYDVETGYYQNRFRDYDPSVGRYIEPDPLGLTGGINTYAYGGANPVSHVDSSGLACTTNDGVAYCGYPGGPNVTLPVHPEDNFPPSMGDGFTAHMYHYDNVTGCDDATLLQALIDNPAPGDVQPASEAGTNNTATALGFPNDIRSYVTQDVNTGQPVVVNMTSGNAILGLSPGYVAQTVSDGVIHTYGEGLALKQAIPYVSEVIDKWIWQNHAEEIARKCKCKKH